MDVRAGIAAGTESPFVSTGHLPADDLVDRLVVEAHDRYRTNDEGSLSDVYPALARVPRGLFGICVAGIGGDLHAAGDVDAELTIMSVAKPFLYALVCERVGREEPRQLIGVNATGLPFNSIEAVERGGDGRTNPMVNPGAIAVTSLVPGADTEEKCASSGRGSRALPAASWPSTTRSTAPRARRTTGTRASPGCSRATGASTPTRPRRSSCTPASRACG
jgi:hypothetical protein